MGLADQETLLSQQLQSGKTDLAHRTLESHRARCCGFERSLGVRMLTGEKQMIPGDQKCRGRGGPRGQGEARAPDMEQRLKGCTLKMVTGATNQRIHVASRS